MFEVYVGFHLGFLGFLTQFLEDSIFKAYLGFHVRLDFRTKDLGFRVSRFGNKSRHPFGEMDGIPNLIKHRPCAVKTHFAGQHTRPGRNVVLCFVLFCHVLFC